MVKISRRRVARKIAQLLVEQPKNRAQLVRQIAAYLVDTKQARSVDLLIQDIADEMYLQYKHLTVEAVSAFSLDNATKKTITTLLTEATGAKSIDLSSRIDPALLGGVIVHTPRQQFDASVRRKVNLIGYGHGGAI